MKSWGQVLALASLLAMAAGKTGAAQSFVYVCDEQKLSRPLWLQIEDRGNETEVRFWNEFGDQERTVFENGTWNVLSADYRADDGRQFTEVEYDYAQGRIRVSGQFGAEYPLEGPVYENNGSLWFLFARLAPASGQPREFKVVQSNLLRISDGFQRWLLAGLVGPIPMRLAYHGQEALGCQGRQETADKYVLAVNAGALAAFWPHHYTFWYRTSDRVLLQYEGVNGQGKLVRYRLEESCLAIRP